MNIVISWVAIIGCIALGGVLLLSNVPAFGDGIYDRNEAYIGRTDDRGIIYDRLERRVGRVERGGCND